jgi:hypothetical protein
VISPLLSNLYMRRFVLGWKQRGLERKLQARIVSYADDYVICCKGSAEEALVEMRWMMERLKLTINEAKTHVRHLPQERFDFLGYNFGRCYSPTTGRPFIGTRPSKKSLSRVIGKIRDCTASKTTWQEAETVVSQINRLTAGWANYFSLGPVTDAYKALDQYTWYRLRRWLCAKHKVGSTGTTRYPREYFHEVLGLEWLQPRVRNFPWAKA